MGSPESLPLIGRNIVVTRATAVGGTLAARLRAAGADVLEAPTTVIQALDPTTIDRAVASIAAYDWLVLTSQVGVRMFFDALRRGGVDVRALAGKKVAVIGPTTATALRSYGVEPTVVPHRFVAESLLAAMTEKFSMNNTKVLYATAEDARDVVPVGLRQSGASVDVVAMYRSVPNRAAGQMLQAAIDRGAVDLVTFASASSVDSFVELVGADRATRCKAVSIGPITTAAARGHAIDVVVESPAATIDALVDALAAMPRSAGSRSS